jgi:hypothetical protein
VVDKKTLGKGFSRTVSLKKCAPDNLETHIIEGKCYLKGERGDGSVYLVSGTKDRCRPSDTKVSFAIARDGLGGKCISTDLATGEKFNEPMKKCRPDDVDYLTFEIQGESECYEVAREGGRQAYIKKASNDKCRPSQVIYQWIQTGPSEGQCFLMAAEGESDYREKVSYKKCSANFDLMNSFEVTSSTYGKCFLIDSETKGQLFKVSIGLDDCRPDNTAIQLVSIDGRAVCLEVDENDPVQGFRRRVSMKNCQEGKRTYIWKPDSKDPMKGRCEQLFFLGDKAIFKNTNVQKCRPVETKNIWFVESEEKVLLGKCYEVATEGGAEEYVDKVSRKNCRPKTELVLKYFHPKDFEKGGCYFVDQETLGGRYSERTSEKKCKQQMFPKKGG